VSGVPITALIPADDLALLEQLGKRIGKPVRVIVADVVHMALRGQRGEAAARAERERQQAAAAAERREAMRGYRKLTPEQVNELRLLTLQGDDTLHQLAVHFDVHVNTITNWRRTLRAQGLLPPSKPKRGGMPEGTGMS
jgi:hypothetical protein